MPVQSTNPDYDAHIAEWEMMDDALEGECAISGNDKYLPKPAGMVEAEKRESGNGYLYENYRDRAQYEHWVRDSLRSMMGLVSRLIPEIALPSGLKGLEDNATADGFGLKQLFFRMVRQAISHGRVPLVVNIDESGEPYFSTYATRNAINWDTADQGGRQDLVLSVFREFRKKGGDRYSHDCDTVFREFFMRGDTCYTAVRNEGGELVEDERPLGTTGTDNRLVKGLAYLPVIYCGSTDNSPEVDEVPLLTMARAAVKSYQISADYFQHIHDSSHDQKYVIGLDGDTELNITGPASAWMLPLGCTVGALKTDPAGIDAKRIAMDDQKNAALEAGAKVMDVGGTESGEARKTRQNDQHATLHSIVITVAEAVEQGLRYAAEWKGYDPKQVTFKVNPEFVTPVVDAQVLAELLKGVMAGTISADTYWQYLTTGKLPERPYEEEAELISDERESAGINLDKDDANDKPDAGGQPAAGADDAPLGNAGAA